MFADLLELAESVVLKRVLDQFDLVARVELVEEALVQRWLRCFRHLDTWAMIRSEHEVLRSGVYRVGHRAEPCNIPLLEPTNIAKLRLLMMVVMIREPASSQARLSLLVLFRRGCEGRRDGAV